MRLGWRFWIDLPRFYWFDSFYLLLAAEFLAIPGLRFWESCDSRFCAAKARYSFSGFRKRGRRNGVASDFFPFSSVFFRFLPFSSVFFRFFLLFSFRFLHFFPFSGVFIPGFSEFFRLFLFSSVFFRFLPFHFQKKTGRHRSRDPFCETPIFCRGIRVKGC